MQWILEHFQLVIILVGAFLVWLKGLFDRKVAERQERENPPDTGDDGMPWEYEDEAVESPVLLPPPVPPPLPRASAAAPSGPVPDRRQRHRPGPRRQTRDETPAAAPAAASQTTAASVRAAAGRFHSRLRQPGELRRAVVLREILGPPAGLR